MMYPDSPEANKLGCKCPAASGGNKKGEGTLIDGVRAFTVHPECPVHSDWKWWTREPPKPATS